MDLHSPLLLSYAACDIVGGKLSQKSRREWKRDFFKKQALLDQSLFGEKAFTLKSKESPLLGILDYILRCKQIKKSWSHNEE